MSLCETMFQIVRNLINWFRPTEIEKPECVLRLLQKIYPTVDWDKVKFYDGLPWYTSTFAPSTVAITIPGTYGVNNIRIYFRDFAPCSCQGLTTIVHEGFHVLQYNDIGTGGLGWIRLFMIEYLGCTISNGYDNNPMEIAAYEYDAQFRACCNTLEKPICDCSKDPPSFNQDALNQLIINCPTLIKENSGFKYNCGFFPAVLGVILVLLIAILLPVADLIFYVITLVLILISSLLCVLEWIWNIIVQIFSWLWGIIVQVLSFICDWTIEWEKSCVEWTEEVIEQCTEYRDDGYEECSEYRDDGYEECSEWREESYKQCCDWAPCSWFCRAWVWIVSSICIAWIWVSSLVCIAWIWVSSLVCIAWAYLVRIICKSFAWIIKSITCW